MVTPKSIIAGDHDPVIKFGEVFNKVGTGALAQTVGVEKSGSIFTKGSISTSTVPEDVQPFASVTVKLYVPTAKRVIIVVVVLPATFPGLIVQLPLGKPLNSILPVGVVQVGWVIVPIVGLFGGSVTVTFNTCVVAHCPAFGVKV